MSFKKPASIKDLLLHLGVVIGSVIILIVFMFYVYMPIRTNHGETITVPDVVGMTPDELSEFLDRRNLRFEVTEDSSYSPTFPALAVLRQVPRPNTKVKENRKIYVTLNAESPPLVRMPRVEDLSLKSAQMVLKSYDLKLGKIRYVPDDFFGVVIEANINGRSVLEGEKIEKGSEISLVVGDGFGNTIFQSPYLHGLDEEEAIVVIIGSGLRVGKIRSTISSMAGFVVKDSIGADVIEMREIAPGSVQQQYPKPEKILKIGDPIDLWIYRPDSINTNTTILDDN
ncbi:MAG: PASTA domain-containing protein [Cyclobacteriaceae bacterium]